MKQFLKNVTNTSSIISPTGEPNWKMISAILFLLLLLLVGVTLGSEFLRPKNIP